MKNFFFSIKPSFYADFSKFLETRRQDNNEVVNVVKKIVTDLAVIEVTSKGFKLTEVAPGVSKDEIINSTDADLIIDKNLRTMVL